jgi:hypothetical protein
MAPIKEYIVIANILSHETKAERALSSSYTPERHDRTSHISLPFFPIVICIASSKSMELHFIQQITS